MVLSASICCSVIISREDQPQCFSGFIIMKYGNLDSIMH